MTDNPRFYGNRGFFLLGEQPTVAEDLAHGGQSATGFDFDNLDPVGQDSDDVDSLGAGPVPPRRELAAIVFTGSRLRFEWELVNGVGRQMWLLTQGQQPHFEVIRTEAHSTWLGAS